MQTLATILPAANPESVRNRAASLPADLSGPAHESFADWMSRAMPPGSADAQGNGADQAAQPQKPFPAHKQMQASPLSNKAASGKILVDPGIESAALQAAALMTLEGKALLKATGADAEKISDSPGPKDASVPPDAAQTLLLPMVAPVLVPGLPKTFAPLPTGTRSTPADIAISMADTATKNPMPTAGAVMGVENLPSQPVAGVLAGLKPAANPADAIKTTTAEKLNQVETKLSATEAAQRQMPAKAGGENWPPLNLSAIETEPLTSPENSAAPARNKDLATSATFQIHGTPAAKQVVPMKNEMNTNKVAGLGEKVLPGKVIPVAAEKNLPGRGSFVVPITVVGSPADTAAANSLAAGPGVAAAGVLDNSPVSSNVIDLPARALDRTHDMVALHAVRLVEAKTDSLQVVIKPGAGIELSLELRQHAGGIEAHAVLQSGDFNQMNLHWADLQQRLEQRGIRLTPLTGGENSTSFGGNPEFQRQQPRPPEEQDPLAAGAFAEFALATALTALTGQPAAYAAALRGWQSWA